MSQRKMIESHPIIEIGDFELMGEYSTTGEHQCICWLRVKSVENEKVSSNILPSIGKVTDTKLVKGIGNEWYKIAACVKVTLSADFLDMYRVPRYPIMTLEDKQDQFKTLFKNGFPADWITLLPQLCQREIQEIMVKSPCLQHPICPSSYALSSENPDGSDSEFSHMDYESD